MIRTLLLAMCLTTSMLHAALESDVNFGRRHHKVIPSATSFISSYDDAFQIMNEAYYPIFFPTDRAIQGITHSPNDTFIIENDGLYMIDWSFFYYVSGFIDVVGVKIVKNGENLEPSPQVVQTIHGATIPQDFNSEIQVMESIPPVTVAGSLTIPLKAGDQLKLIVILSRPSAAIRSAMISIVQVGQ